MDDFRRGGREKSPPPSRPLRFIPLLSSASRVLWNGPLADGAAVLALGLLVLLAFWHIGPAGRVIAGGDLFTYFYPYWAEAARALRAGRLPLWNPYLFMGVPFLANSQAGVLYPLNWPFWLLLPPHAALHWSALLHLWLAGSGAYLYARVSLRLGRMGAWTAGAAFALGGYLGAQVEHINQLQALSWLPWALLLYDRALRLTTKTQRREEKSYNLRFVSSCLRGKYPKTTKAQRHEDKSSFFNFVSSCLRGKHSKTTKAQRHEDKSSFFNFVSSCLRGKHFLWLAVVIGLMLLAGHTQSAFIGLVGLGISALVPRAEVPLGRRLGVLAGASVLGALLVAAQLVPTAELARHSVRSGGLPFNERVSFSLSPLYMARALLPPYGQLVAPERLEYVAFIGVTGLLLALHFSLPTLPVSRLHASHPPASRLHASRLHASRSTPLWLSLSGLFLALGLYNPLYLLLARFVPGFAHFRAPARWLALWALGAALLAGMGLDRIARPSQDSPGRKILQPLAPDRERSGSDAKPLGLSESPEGASQNEPDALASGETRRPLMSEQFTQLPYLAIALALFFFLWGALGGGADWRTIALWLTAAALGTALLALSRRFPHPAVLGLAALLLAELLLSARTLPHARATAPEAYTSLRPATAHLLASGRGKSPPDRFLSLSALAFDPGDKPELEVIYGPQLSRDAVYSLLIAAKHREVLSPNLPLAFRVPAVDGYDGGLLPLARYIALERAFLPEEAVAIDGRLRENLRAVPDGRWLSLLNVRYIITDKVFDAWLDDVFYDLQFGADLAAGESAAVAEVPPFEATALGLVSYLEGAAALPDGTVVGQVTVTFADGSARTFPLRAGKETAEGVYGPGVAHAQAPVGGHFWPGRPEGNDYAVRLRWSRATRPTGISVQATLPQGRLVVRGLSLIDERTGAFQSLVISDRGRFRLVHSGDVKIYENLDVLPRAFVVHRARGAMAFPADFDPTAEIILEGGADLDARPGGPESVRVTTYEPERVEVEVEVTAPGYLVLTDAHYPGWRAWVDGREVPIVTADRLFRAVYLEPGRHRVEFRFRPRSLWLGAAINLGTLAGIAAGIVVRRGALRPQ
ncbi:MAG: YfhO family protein [Thermoflexales bacterium]|nr:YfhO family protein [Thermoflexales bacterium]